MSKRVLLLVALMLPLTAQAVKMMPCDSAAARMAWGKQYAAAKALCDTGREMRLEGRSREDVKGTVLSILHGDDQFMQTGEPSKAANLMGVMLYHGFNYQDALIKAKGAKE